MQQPVSPFAIREAEEVSGLALTLAFWVGQIADSVRCPGRLNGVSGGVQIIFLPGGERLAAAGQLGRDRGWLAARLRHDTDTLAVTDPGGLADDLQAGLDDVVALKG